MNTPSPSDRTESPELPRETIELIYRASCCKPTPEEAQKEPCACVAAVIVEQVEEWACSLVRAATSRAERAEAKCGAMRSILTLIADGEQRARRMGNAYLLGQATVQAMRDALSGTAGAALLERVKRLEEFETNIRDAVKGFAIGDGRDTHRLCDIHTAIQILDGEFDEPEAD
jgi:hypothetical protein